MSITIQAQVVGLAVEVVVTTTEPDNVPITAYRTVVQTGRRTVVRGFDHVLDHGGIHAVTDYEIPYQADLVYEAECGPDHATATAVRVEEDQGWLRDVAFPEKSMALCISDHAQSSRDVRTALLRATGRRNPIAVTDIREGRVGKSSFVTLTLAEREQFLELTDTGDVLMLTGPWTWQLGPLYLVMMAVTEKRVGTLPYTEREWDCDWVEVDPPVMAIPGTPRTWAEVTPYLWLDVRKLTWAQVLYPPSAPVPLRADGSADWSDVPEALRPPSPRARAMAG